MTQTWPWGSPNRCAVAGVVDLLDRLHLQEVVARAKAAHLAQPPFHGPRADLPGVGVGDSALILAAQQVAFDAVAVFQRVAGAASQHVPHLPGAGEMPDASPARPPRNSGRQLVHQRAQHRHYFVTLQAGSKQADTAGDIESNPARGDHPAGRRIGGRDPADREPIPQVQVRHRIGRRHNARQRSHIGHLLQRTVRSQIRDQLTGGIHAPRHPHLSPLRDPEPVRGLLNEFHLQTPSLPARHRQPATRRLK